MCGDVTKGQTPNTKILGTAEMPNFKFTGIIVQSRFTLLNPSCPWDALLCWDRAGLCESVAKCIPSEFLSSSYCSVLTAPIFQYWKSMPHCGINREGEDRERERKRQSEIHRE